MILDLSKEITVLVNELLAMSLGELMDRDKCLRIFTYINRRKDQQLQAIITESLVRSRTSKYIAIDKIIT